MALYLQQQRRLYAPPKEKLGRIQGRRATSFPEWRVAVALHKIEMPFRYQVNFFGGNRTLGGQRVDFMVLTKPYATPLFVDGDYWHGSASQRERDKLKRATLVNALGGTVLKPIVLMGSELQTQEEADRRIRDIFRGRS